MLYKQVGRWHLADIKVVHGKARKHLILRVAVRRVIIAKSCVK